MFASNVHITDGLHGYENANEPYKYQKLFRIAPIRIKRGCWIGQNVVILPGVTIGELTIIGANSVVTKNIPDRCIAVGAPAKVIKTWDENTQRWVSVENIV
jgi:acetyltransferase-like isoleucine patch superfamily enzyme